MPLVATAIHDGHALRSKVAAIMSLPEADRLREEDPFTAGFATVAKTRVIGLRSRFEVDLNRPRERAVYIKPRDAWGLTVWTKKPAATLIQRSLKEYDTFYEEMHRLFSELQRQYARFVVFDLHSYNHRRDGLSGPPADPASNPEVNIGTGTMDRERWAPIIDRFIADLHGFDFLGRHLDVRENVKFRGGHFARWTHATFPGSACVLSIEFKKFFMDEWTGEADGSQLEAIRNALAYAVPGVLETLENLSL